MVTDHDAYVYFGYLPDLRHSGLDWLEYDEDSRDSPRTDGESHWVARGVRAFDAAMTEQLERTPVAATHVVPLSAGLDSRAILGWLAEHLPPSQLVTVTYGTPGTYDYELSQRVARTLGVRQELMNLVYEPWQRDRLAATAALLEHPVSVFEGHVHRSMCEHVGPGCVYWSGFLAGSAAGVHLPLVPSADRMQAARRFVSGNRTPHFKDAAFDDEMARQIVEQFPWPAQDGGATLTWDHQLDLGIRQRYYIRSVLLVPGFEFRTPFAGRAWLSFILNVPYRWLPGEEMYGKVLRARFPDLYRLPVRNNAGLPLSASRARFLLNRLATKAQPRVFREDPYRSDPATNYVDFGEVLRHRSGLQDGVASALDDLKQRQLFHADRLDTWWREHLTRKANHTALLLNLASLELLLEAHSLRAGSPPGAVGRRGGGRIGWS